MKEQESKGRSQGNKKRKKKHKKRGGKEEEVRGMGGLQACRLVLLDNHIYHGMEASMKMQCTA